MKKRHLNILNIFKIIASGITAIIIISCVLFAYSILPVHIENPNGNTDYIWPPNSLWVKLTEGISIGRFDGNGYNNISVIDNPDILIVGSSHMEATNVMQNESISYLLNKKFEGRHTVYNIGISGHHFFKCCQYLPRNMEMYGSSLKYVIIETSNTFISENDVDSVLNHTVDFSKSNSSGIVGTLQKIPFVRTAYHQFEDGLLDIILDRREIDVSQTNVDNKVDKASYNKLFEFLSNLEKVYGVELIIMYHPMESFDDKGCIVFDGNEATAVFDKAAKEHSIDFIDLTDDFENMYFTAHKCAHGFITGRIGEGHMNADGHACAAEAVYMLITEKENGTNVND